MVTCDLNEILAEAATEAVKEAIDDFAIEEAVEEAVEKAITDSNIDDLAADAVEEAVTRSDIDELAAEAVDAALEDKLPGKVKEVLLRLLSDDGFLERLTAALFEQV